jgi:outer membrane protein
VALLSLAAPSDSSAGERKLSLSEAISTAIANNSDLYLVREDAGIAAAAIALAESHYDPVLFGRGFAARDVQPGSATSFSWKDRRIGGEAGLSGRLGTGLEYSLSLSSTAQSYQDAFSTVYDPAYTSALTLSLTQPLLRGAWEGGNRQLVVEASQRAQQSDALLRAQLEQTVSLVEVAYWNLVRVHAELEARAASVQLAREQLEESQRLVRLGAVSKLDEVEAQAGVSRRLQELHSAEAEVAEADGALLDLLQLRTGDRGWRPDDILVPTDSPDVIPVGASIPFHLALARKNRPDLRAAGRLTSAESAALEVAANRAQPLVELIARAGLIGFAGDLAQNYATAGVNQAAGLDPPFFSDPDLDGGWGDSVGNLFGGKHYALYLGLRVELPIRNQEAEARYSIQRRQLSKARIAERSIQARIENEVRTGLNRLRANASVVEAADQAVASTARLLDGIRKRFRNDDSTSFDVLRVVDELTRSKIEAARARARYQIALSRLEAANGTLLERRGITVRALRSR